MEFISLDNLEWIRPHLPVSDEDRVKAEFELQPLDNAGGLTGAMRVLTVHIPGNNSFNHRRFIYKTVFEASKKNLQSLGCPREAFFYQFLAAKLRSEGTAIPLTLFAFGDMATGDKTLIMEDLSYHGIQSGYFYGPGTPLNWSKDLPSLLQRVPNPVGVQEVALDTFLQAARLHRCYWGDSSILQFDWLRGSDWIVGKGREAWDASMDKVRNDWSAAKTKIAAGSSAVLWDANLVATVDKSIENLDYDKYITDLQARKWTLVHGDYHPANIMWVWDETSLQGKSFLLDWEMVGVGSGPQDLAQALISHMSPVQRKESETILVEAYYKELMKDGHVQDFSFEQCWHDYKFGGAERWIWLLAYLTAVCPDKMVQYFHDQVASFLTDHNINPQNIGMPRA